MGIIIKAKKALWDQSGLLHSDKGYCDSQEDNFVEGVQIETIKQEYSQGSGHEWKTKIKAIHSSAALVANTFGRWVNKPEIITIDSIKGFTSIQFEVKCKTGLKGNSPNLDVLLSSPTDVVGIESKLLEPLSKKKPKISASYLSKKLPQCEEVWWMLINEVANSESSYLDISQLIKHYLGLRKQYENRKKINLIYLYWIPLNSQEIVEYKKHNQEISNLSKFVNFKSDVEFMAVDYLSLWQSWEKDEGLKDHVNNLKRRYRVRI